jgi:hypothetical protein
LNSRATGPKLARGPGRQRPSWLGSRGAQPARCGPVACSRGPQASEASQGAAPARRSGARAGALSAHSTPSGALIALHRGATSSDYPTHRPGKKRRAIGHRNRTATRWRISPVCGGGVGRLRWSGKSATPQEASPRRVGAPGPAHEDGRHGRRLGIDGAAETEARHDRGGLPEGGCGEGMLK